MTSVGRRSLLPLANVIVGSMLGLLALKITTLYLGRSVYGEFQFALASVGLIYLFADLGMGDAHTKRVSEGMPAGDCFVTYSVFRIASSAAFVLATFSLIFVYTMVLGRTLEDLTMASIVAAVLYYVMKGLQSVASATFDARLQTARSQLGGFIETLVRVTLVLAAAFAFRATVPFLGHVEATGPLVAFVRLHPAASLALAWAAGSFVAAVVLFVYMFRELERGRFRWSILRSYFAFAIPLFLPNSVALLAFFIDRVMLGVFGTSVNAADFAAPRQIVGVIEGAAGAVGVVLFPAISRAVAAGARAETPGMLDRSTRYLSLALLPPIAFMAFFPEPVLDITTSGEFTGDALVLTILAIMIYFVVLSRPHVTYLMGHGRTRDAGRAGLIASVVIIVLNLLLVPDDIKSLHLKLFGLKALGSAIATLIGAALGYALFVRASRRVESGERMRIGHAKHLVAAFVLGGVIWLVERATGSTFHRWYTMLAYAVLGTVAYVLALILMRELTREDWEFVRSTLDPGEMLRYLRSEL